MLRARTLGALALSIFVGSIGLAARGAQNAGPATGLIVLSKGDLTLSVVDPVTLQVVGRAPSGPDPHEVVTSGDGRIAYIANYNGGGNIISVIDLVAMKPLPMIDLGALRAPHGLWFTGGRLWFTAESSKAIGSYDPATSKVDWVLGTGQDGTHMIVVSPDVQRMATTNIQSATVTIIERAAGRGGRAGTPPAGGAAGRSSNPQGNWSETVIPVGRGAEGFDISPDGKEIWAANAQDGTVSVIDVATKKVVQTLAVEVGGANRLKFTPDGKLVFVSTLSGPNLTILDAATRAVVKRLPIGRGAAGLEMQPDGTRAYAACTPDDYVAVIDLKTLTVAGKINAGRQPDGLAWMARR